MISKMLSNIELFLPRFTSFLSDFELMPTQGIHMYPLSIKYPKALSFRPAPGSTTNSGREFRSDGGE